MSRLTLLHSRAYLSRWRLDSKSSSANPSSICFAMHQEERTAQVEGHLHLQMDLRRRHRRLTRERCQVCAGDRRFMIYP